MFLGEDERERGRSPISPNGTYSIKNVLAGPVTIIVETKTAKPATPPPQAKMKDVPPDAQKGMYKAQGSSGKYVKIPDKYGDTKESGLTYQVTSGSQTHDIELK